MYMLTIKPDIRELDARAVRASVNVVSRVATTDLGRATPCTDWTLADLLAHMTVQHYGFAAAAAGESADLMIWQPEPLGDDPVRAYATAADHVITAFAADDVLDADFALPEISTRLTFRGRQAIQFHFIDYVVHTWDVARALGVPPDLPEDLVRAALPITRAVPDGAERRRPGAAFQPGLPSGYPDPLDQIVALLGRSPNWPAVTPARRA
jgi:uncharacterized protein (TIGR03086 family)